MYAYGAPIRTMAIMGLAAYMPVPQQHDSMLFSSCIISSAFITTVHVQDGHVSGYIVPHATFPLNVYAALLCFALVLLPVVHQAVVA